MKENILFSVIASIVFFLSLLATLKDYGTSWDEAVHFSRGQVFLHFFLTESKDYSNLSVPRRSFYQFDYHGGDYWFKDNGGHPPISDIMAATLNYTFFQKLGWLDDIGAYHLFNILASSLLVFIVVVFAASTFGKFQALVSFLSLVTYPLFFSESHFNVKDPAQSAFFAATIFFFYLSLKGRAKWLLISALFFSLSLGTKFNILFLPLIIIPYLIFRFKVNLSNLGEQISKIPKSFFVVLAICPIIISIIFIGLWPYLWGDPWGNLIKVFRFYKELGTGFNYQPSNFYIGGFNLFPLSWIVVTTPPVLLILSLFGIVSSIINRKVFYGVTILWLLWFLVPILRVTIPGTSIYGGVRQIMEFLPALALLSGLGAWQILEWSKKFKRQTLVSMLLVLVFVWPTFILLKIHPNQNVYFNSLIGNLKGAKEKNFPSWGNSYGNAHYQGIKWFNQNAPYGSKIALIQGIEVNAPAILLRQDIDLDNANWSGIERKGEYLMELTFNDTGKAFHYTWEYVEKFLVPVYQLEVDGVPILKIWKNDLEHTKPEYKMVERPFRDLVSILEERHTIKLDLGKTVMLSKMEVNFTNSGGCSVVGATFVETSRDNSTWVREGDWIPFPQVGKKTNLEKNNISFHFAARNARFIRFILDSDKSCLLQEPNFQIYII